MRHYDIVFGILLTLSIIDFALTAPVPVQEKLHAHVGAMHIPKHVITVLENRGNDDLVAADFLNWVKAVESSDARTSSSSALQGPDQWSKTDVAHASSSSALPGLGHGPKTDVTAPASNPASLTANPDPLMEPSSQSSTGSSVAGGIDDSDNFAKQVKLAKEFFKIKTVQKPVETSYAHSLSSSAPLGFGHGSKTHMLAPAPNPALTTVNLAPLMEPPSQSPTGSSMAGGNSNLDDFKKQAKEYFEARRKAYLEKQRNVVQPTEAHASPSSTQSGFDHGSKNDVPAAPPNPASSTAYPGLLMEPPSRSPTGSSMAWGYSNFDDFAKHFEAQRKAYLEKQRNAVQPTEAHASPSSALSGFDHGSKNDVPAAPPNPASSTAYTGLLMEPPSQSPTGSSMAWGYSNFDDFAKQSFEARRKAFFEKQSKAVKSTEAHASPSSALPGFDHGSKNDVPAAPPNPASSTAYPGLLMEPPSQSPTGSSMAWGYSNFDDFVKQRKESFEARRKAYLEKQSKAVKSTEAHASPSLALSGSDHGSKNDVPAAPPNPASSTTYPGLLMNPASSLPPTAPGIDATLQDKWWYNGPDGPMYTPMSLGYGSDHVSTGVHAPQPKPNPRPSKNPYFAWNHLMENPPPVRPAPPIEFVQTHENQAVHVQDTNPGPPTDPEFDWDYWMDNLPSPKRLRPGSSNELDDEAFQGPLSPEWQ